MYLEIDCFSGRPNPQYRLTDEQEALVAPYMRPSTWSENIEDRQPGHPILGFRCFQINSNKVKRESGLEELCKKLALAHGANPVLWDR